MKRIPISERRFKQILIGIWCFSIGILLTTFIGISNTSIEHIHTEHTIEHIYIQPFPHNDTYMNYSNSMVRAAINYTTLYVNNETLFQEEQFDSWMLWKDYEDRVTNASYNYWILSYSFGI